MQTPSHMLIAAAAVLPLRRRHLNIPMAAVVVGAALPDLPFFLLTLAGEIYFRWWAPLPSDGSVMEYLHFTLFYTDPLWIISHNFFHSLIINTLLLAGGWWWMRRGSRRGSILFWLAASMLLHVGIDILTHRSDGPLIWFPINWHYRFASPVSYWESAYFGQAFMLFEYTLDAVLAIWLALKYRAHWQ